MKRFARGIDPAIDGNTERDASVADDETRDKQIKEGRDAGNSYSRPLGRLGRPAPESGEVRGGRWRRRAERKNRQESPRIAKNRIAGQPAAQRGKAPDQPEKPIQTDRAS